MWRISPSRRVAELENIAKMNNIPPSITISFSGKRRVVSDVENIQGGPEKPRKRWSFRCFKMAKISNRVKIMKCVLPGARGGIFPVSVRLRGCIWVALYSNMVEFPPVGLRVFSSIATTLYDAIHPTVNGVAPRAYRGESAEFEIRRTLQLLTC